MFLPGRAQTLMDSGPQRCVSLLSRSRGTRAPHLSLSPPVGDWHWRAEGGPVRQEAAGRQGPRGTGDVGGRRGAAVRPWPHHHGKTDVVCKALTELVTSSASLAAPVQCPPGLADCRLPSRPSLSVTSQQCLLRPRLPASSGLSRSPAALPLCVFIPSVAVTFPDHGPLLPGRRCGLRVADVPSVWPFTVSP